MGERWIKEAEDLKAAGTSGQMTRNHAGVKVTWHVTVSPSGGSMFDAMHRVLTTNKSEPHILYDPLTDRLGQYFPLDRSARALANDGSRPTNRDGTINIQIEVVAQPDGFTRYWKPGPNYRALMRAIRSWGIPDTWPAGKVAPSGRADQQVPRSWAAYVRSGHFGHCHVPGNSHWDPGPIDQAAIFTAASTGPAPAKTTTAVEVGAAAYEREDVARLQRVLGLKDDGIWGEQTERQAQAIRRCLKPGMKRSVWDRARFWRLRMSRAKGKQTSDSLRRAHQWALGVAVDGDWGPATDAAWLQMRQQHKR